MNILITELMWDEGIDMLKEIAEVDYDPSLWNDRHALLQKVKEVDALIVRNQTKVDKELLQAAIHVKVIGRLGVGLDNIDLNQARLLEVDVVYAKNANAISVAEYVISALLEASRLLYKAHEDVQRGNWDRKRYTGRELYGKTLGLVGMGEIAHRVAKRATAFGMQIIGYDPFITVYDFPVAETGIKMVSFEDLLLKSDFISIHVPLKAQTRAMFSNPEFKLMKETALIINTSRGGIIDEEALLHALDSKSIAGAFLDVLEQEPIDANHPLLPCSNIVITPHIAGLTEESQVRTSVLVAQEVSKILLGQPSLCVVR